MRYPESYLSNQVKCVFPCLRLTNLFQAHVMVFGFQIVATDEMSKLNVKLERIPGITNRPH